jgi:hypothetical protein
MATRNWNPEDRAAFITAWMAGDKRADMADRFNLSESGVTWWCRQFDLPMRPRKVKRGSYAKTAGKVPRVCLTCNREFDSDGIWNRVCPNCRGTVEFTQADTRPPMEFHAGHKRGAL